MNLRARTGLWAGFITALGMTALLLVGGYLQIFPPLMHLQSMALVVDPIDSPRLALIVGAVNHTAAGAAIGLLYGWLAPRFSPMTGIAALMISWTTLMLAVLPLTGHGFFGLREGPSLALWTLLLHTIFGFVLGTLARLRLARAT
jgi:hypothetical protein